MIRKIQNAILQKRTVTPNSYNEQVESWESQSTPIEVIISYKSASASPQNDVLTVRYTITGLTYDTRVTARDKIVLGTVTYTVDSIIETNRMRMMNLLEDKAI